MTVSQTAEFLAQTGNGIHQRICASQVRGDVVEATEMLMARLVQSGNTLRVLCDHTKSHDWTWDGASILRTSYDAMLQALYIFHDDAKRDGLARRFLDFRVVEQMKLLRVVDEYSPRFSRWLSARPLRATNEPEIKKQYAIVCQKYGFPEKKPPNNWHGLGLGALAKKCGYEAECQFLQKYLSAIVHSSVFGISGSGPMPENLVQYQWTFAYRVLDKIAAYARIEPSATEKELFDFFRQNIFDRGQFPTTGLQEQE